jgi:hypothetical protein
MDSVLGPIVGELLLSPAVKKSGGAVEDLQVLDYAPGGEYVFHHDGAPRVLTILYYLNGIGETWFPLADDDGDDDHDPNDDDDDPQQEKRP